ncbi:MAG: S41 family peptidase [Armatimonadota bacterium]
MRRGRAPLAVAVILAIGLLAPPALAQPAPVSPAQPNPPTLAQSPEFGVALFVETYRVLRDESLAIPTSESLLRGAEAGLRALLREEGQAQAALTALTFTGDERADLEQAVQRIEQVQHLSRARPVAVVYAAVSGMVASLRDPNSAFFSPEAFAQFVRRTTQGDQVVGVGIIIEDKSGQPAITEVIEGSPASEAGLRGGDVITAVDGTPTTGQSLEQVSAMIRGAEGTPVVLTIRREGQSAPLVLTITRRRIQVRVLSTRMLPSGIGYMRLTQFTQPSSELVANGLRQLMQEGAKGIVLDLRGNPGGLLEASVNIASHFLDRGVVTTLESGRGQSTAYAVRPREPKYSGPLVLLVDRGSASASEVVGGALQDSGIKLVGTRTYGKATVQAVYRFRDGSGLRLTISRYLTPTGRDLEGQGLSPDVEVASAGAAIGSSDDVQLTRAVALVTQAAAQPMLRPGGYRVWERERNLAAWNLPDRPASLLGIVGRQIW